MIFFQERAESVSEARSEWEPATLVSAASIGLNLISLFNGVKLVIFLRRRRTSRAAKVSKSLLVFFARFPIFKLFRMGFNRAANMKTNKLFVPISMTASLD